MRTLSQAESPTAPDIESRKRGSPRTADTHISCVHVSTGSQWQLAVLADEKRGQSGPLAGVRQEEAARRKWGVCCGSDVFSVSGW